jgi:hypothetical protein
VAHGFEPLALLVPCRLGLKIGPHSILGCDTAEDDVQNTVLASVIEEEEALAVGLVLFMGSRPHRSIIASRALT